MLVGNTSFISERRRSLHLTLTRLRSQSKGEAERDTCQVDAYKRGQFLSEGGVPVTKLMKAVQVVRILLNKNVSIQVALCNYRDTLLESGYSPAQLQKFELYGYSHRYIHMCACQWVLMTLDLLI